MDSSEYVNNMGSNCEGIHSLILEKVCQPMNLKISCFVKIFNRRSAKHNWLTKGKQRSGKWTQMNADNKKKSLSAIILALF